jgi:hypothetical protein
VDIAIRDESDHVVRKANKIHMASMIGDQIWLPTKCTEHLDTLPSSMTLHSQDQLLIPYSISSTIEEQATSFFFKTYVTARSPSSAGHLNFLPLMYGQAQEDEALRIVVKSIGMAGLSIATKNPQLMTAPKKNYVSALRLANIALSSRLKSTNDHTLMTVLLLGLYEVRLVLCSSF